jgi:arylsulfatase A-like enzyme
MIATTRTPVALAVPLIAACLCGTTLGAPPRRPNILVILADDLGFGDVRCNNPDRGRIPTPAIDRLCSQGMRFTDAHSSSGVCSPSRYTLLTGRYHWRTGKAGIVDVFGPPLIAPGRPTVATMLRRQGYRTAAIGKWHLGWDWPIPGDRMALFRGMPAKDELEVTPRHAAAWRQVFDNPIPGGPTARGFETYFGTDVPNWPPYCFIENDRTVGVPAAFLPPGLLGNNLASLQGPALPGWKLEPILPALADRAAAFIAEAAAGPGPFFLYLPLTSPHTPLAVTPEWSGRSGLNRYADFVMETDSAVGRVLDALERSGAAENTLVLFTSDNGCAPYIGAKELENMGHFPSGPFRGYKSDVWEGGHRVPFIVRWPGVVAPGGTSGQLVHHADLMATLASITGSPLPDDAGEDSTSFLPILRGLDRPTRSSAVSQSMKGLLAVRRGPWKLIFGRGSGGWTPGNDREPAQLYNLDTDPGETTNLLSSESRIASELTALMGSIVRDGRSTPGKPQPNDKALQWRVTTAPSEP